VDASAERTGGGSRVVLPRDGRFWNELVPGVSATSPTGCGSILNLQRKAENERSNEEFTHAGEELDMPTKTN